MPYLTPNAPTGNSGRVLVIPDTYLPIVNGALQELIADYNWEGFGSDDVDTAVARMLAMYEEFLLSEPIDINGRDVDVPIWIVNATNTTWTWESLATQAYNGIMRMPNAVAVGGYVEFKFSARAGNYKIKTLTRTDNNLGDYIVSVDGVDRQSVSLQSGSPVASVVFTSAAFALTGDGDHLMRFRTIGKQPGSSSNRVGLTLVRLEWQP